MLIQFIFYISEDSYLETESSGKLKVISESFLVDSSSTVVPTFSFESEIFANVSLKKVPSAENLLPAYSSFISNFSQPRFSLQQTSSLIKPTKTIPSYPTTYFNPKNTHSLPSSNNIGPTSVANCGISRDLIPFKCPLCSVIFETQIFLNEHMRKQHSVLI